MTAVGRRHFDWEGCFNARDLGGLPTADGHTTRHGVFLRGDTLCDLTEDGRRSLLEDGVRTVVDLRSDDELAREPNPFATIDGVRYEHRPLNDPGVTSRISAIEDQTERYRVMLDGNGQRVAAILNVIATSPRAVLFHCFAGRDRTGIVAAILLRLAGVPDDAIVQDYALSDERLEKRYDEWSKRWTEADKARIERSIVEAETTIRGTLGHLDEKYGGVEPYLLKHGLDPAAIGRLKGDLID
jgi:protein-tyrosine phosphatase